MSKLAISSFSRSLQEQAGQLAPYWEGQIPSSDTGNAAMPASHMLTSSQPAFGRVMVHTKSELIRHSQLGLL